MSDTVVKDSILGSTKRKLNLTVDYTEFDAEIIDHINSAFASLHQIGVGPSTPFLIEGYSETWDNFTEGRPGLLSVKTYMGMKVRLVFDLPGNSFGIEALKEQCSELEWRLQTAQETP